MARDTARREFLSKASTLLAGATISGSPLARAAAARHDNLPDLSAVAAVQSMRNGDFSAEDYACALLSRAQGLESLNAFRTLDRERVLEAARAVDTRRQSGAALGLLHGLPIPVKDSVNTRTLPTSNGTLALRDFKPREDALVLKPPRVYPRGGAGTHPGIRCPPSRFWHLKARLKSWSPEDATGSGDTQLPQFLDAPLR